MKPETRYLETFRVVCEAGSLRAAAARLHRTEPSLSYQLRQLEEHLGMPLFERRGRRALPNAAGRRLWTFCQQYFDDWARLREDLREARTEAAPLRIAAVSGYGRYVVRPLFLHGPLRDIPIHLRYPTAEDVVRRVESGDCDLGVVHLLQASRRLRFVPLAQEELVLVAPPTGPRPRLTAEALERHAFVTYDESEYLFTAWFHRMLECPPARLRAAAHFEELEEVADWVADGRGLSVVPLHAVAARAKAGELRVLRRRGLRCMNPVFAVLNGAHPVGAALQRTLQALGANA